MHGALHERRVSLGSLLQAYMERAHAPALMHPLVQAVVAAVFITGALRSVVCIWQGREVCLCVRVLLRPSKTHPPQPLHLSPPLNPALQTALFLSAAAIPRLAPGLDQAVALPRDSYLQPYYREVQSTLRVGPPLYFVVEGLNVTAPGGGSGGGSGSGGSGADALATGLDAVCSVAGCRKDSLTSRVCVLFLGRLICVRVCCVWGDRGDRPFVHQSMLYTNNQNLTYKQT
jgi:hypothetical protein